ncbi:hypothetical protein HHK36_016673 [Tetracentron sinense]|uniref:Uncharacterized protein n=1 Tax=Tetracentron sinense TaxID=13715 RepID=A0A834Z368_TETSI|nr:hypothetical protein HHK36_016673 [Tetracentron sinense]
MGRAPCCDKANVKKGPWAPEEDSRLKEFIEKYGTGGNWIALPHKAEPFPSLQRASSQSLSSYKGSNTYYTPTKSLTALHEPISISSNLLNNTVSLQAQDTFVGSLHHYQVKDGLLMFGAEASCSSNSDGGGSSAIGEQMGFDQSYFYNGVEENQKFMLGNGGVNGWTEKVNGGLWGETPLEYGFEEFKQITATNIACNNLFSDESKTQERVMYY